MVKLKMNRIYKTLNFSFLKSEFFVLNSLRNKSLFRHKQGLFLIVDTYNDVSTIVLNDDLLFFNKRLTKGFSFLGVHVLFATKQLKFFDLVPKNFFYNPTTVSVRLLFTGLSFFNFNESAPILRLHGGYVFRVRGMFGFLPYNLFLAIQQNLAIELSLVPFKYLYLVRKRNLRRNRFKHIKLLQRIRHDLPKFVSNIYLLPEDLGLHYIIRFKTAKFLRKGFFLSNKCNALASTSVNTLGKLFLV